jgi:2-deoxy-D-gluconate 3-dehydrogenase|tara:strand:+ start:2208 stop:2930 length:723 start_codon:yes stop_codon:yes gene_type:complete
MIFDFKNKTVIVTGSNSGNGYAIAKAYSDLNANVIRIDKKFSSKLRSKDLVFNLKNYKKVKSLVLKIKKISKKVDILINNAGISEQSLNPYRNFEIYQKTLAVNLHSPFYLISYISEMMPKNSSIVQVTSLGQKFGFKNNPSYQISKAGLAQLTKCAAIDFANKKIRVNNICPGYIKTSMTKKSYKNISKSKERINRTISKRWGVPEDLVGSVLFLTTKYSSYINGTSIDVDGGWSIYGV